MHGLRCRSSSRLRQKYVAKTVSVAQFGSRRLATPDRAASLFARRTRTYSAATAWLVPATMGTAYFLTIVNVLLSPRPCDWAPQLSLESVCERSVTTFGLRRFCAAIEGKDIG